MNIYSSSDLCVDHVGCSEPNGVLVVTFTERTNRALSGLGFGGEFLLKHGFDVIAVKTNLDVWYENLTPEILKMISEYLRNLDKGYVKIVAYGSSMGAYAAIKFSRQLDVDCVLAISPLFDIKDPTESRWREDVVNINSSSMMGDNFISNRAKYCFVVDFKNQDVRHLNKYREIIPCGNISVLSVNYSGHPSGPFLRDIGALTDVVLSVFENDCLPRDLVKYKSNRVNSDSYLFNLAASCVEHGKIKWAESLNGVLLARNSLSAEYHMQSCRIYERRYDLDRAIAACSRAAVLNPKNVNFSLYRDMLVDRQLKNINNIVGRV